VRFLGIRSSRGPAVAGVAVGLATEVLDAHVWRLGGCLGLYDLGVSIENIQDVLGHSSPTVTKTIYVDPTRKIQRDAVERLDFLFDE
jgi:hypothetical protein